MRYHAVALAIICPLLLAGKCEGPKMPASEACAVLNETLYADGQFALNDAEIDALREVNQDKVISIKRFYRERCVKKPAK